MEEDGMKPLRRAWLFARDYIDEFGCAWSVARMRDCERNGGHRWTAAAYTRGLGWMRECKRCGCGECIPPTVGTTTTNTAANYTITRSGS